MKTPLFVLLTAASLWNVAAQTVDSVLTNRLAEPYNVAVEAGVYYITDSANDRVVRFVPDTGVFSTLVGFAGRPGADNGKGVYARFYNPRGLVSVPALGGLVVADYGNHTLRLVNMDGTVTTLAGTVGQPGFDSGPIPAASAHFNFPSALATDSAGNVYIADSKNNAIRKLDLTRTITTVATGFNEPGGIAIGDGGELWVSDSRDHTIKRIRANGLVELAAGLSGQSGSADSIFGVETRFNNPGGLLWLGASSGLLVCDTGNHALRRVFTDPEIGGYSVETYAGTPTQPGFVNGPVLAAKFNAPIGLSKDPVGGFLIADLGNNTLRRIQTSPPKPPVLNPVIGYVTFIKDQFGELLSSLVPVGEAVFNNEVIIAVTSEGGTQTYYTYGETPSSSLEDTILAPSRLTGSTPQPYHDGLRANEVPPSIDRGDIPDVTFKLISTQDSRRPSATVQARFQFRVANPIIVGDNAASFSITNITANAEQWYTIDGSEPTQHGVTSQRALITDAIQLGRIKAPITVRVRAFLKGFKDSDIMSKTFLPEDFEADRISFGFEDGEGSSKFIASAGQTFFAPVTLSLLPNPSMYALQFALTVSGINGSPAVTPGAVGFSSMLKENLQKNIYRTIPAAVYTNLPNSIAFPPYFSDLRVTNSSINLLAVGWLERAGATNLYDSTKQDLITYSIAHDTVFESKNQKVITGGYSFTVPTNATAGQQYQIQISRPSATADGVAQDVLIEPVTGGSLASGTPNSIKNVTVGDASYIVGDAAPFGWFNAGDFGDNFLLNNDVVQVFQSAIYYLNQPPQGSDFFDAMDSSDGAHSGIFSGDDTSINDIQLGDGQLNVDDVYVTFRRSLDPSLTWYRRSWQNGVRQAVAVDNVFRGSPDLPGERWTFAAADLPAGSLIPGDPSVVFSLGDTQVTPGQTMQIPVRSRVTSSYPLRVLMLNVTVEPLDGAPALTVPVEFTPVSTLGAPTLTTTRGVQNFAGVWLNNHAGGVAGDATVGTLKVVIPPDASPNAAYRVHFDHASASPNGLALFPKQVQDGLLTLKDRTVSTAGDGIPDSWKLRYFGSVSNPAAAPTADPDGDGVSNWDEFKAGTNPIDALSHFRLSARPQGLANGGARALTLRWPSMLNKTYTVESAPSLSSGPWTLLNSSLAGTGQDMQFTPSSSTDGEQFFRVRVSE